MEVVSEKELASLNLVKNITDPNEFDSTMMKLLISQGAEKHVNTFRQHNIGQITLVELSEADLIKLGVDDDIIRRNLMDMVKVLPISQETNKSLTVDDNDSRALSIRGRPTHVIQLSIKEITDVLEESSDHLNRIQMSLRSINKALKKEEIPDTLVFEDRYASDVAMTTLDEITKIFETMQGALMPDMMVSVKSRNQKKKIIVGAIGSALIITLAVLFAKSVKQLK